MLLPEAKYNPFDFVVELFCPQCLFVVSLYQKSRLHDVKVVIVVMAGCKMIFCVVSCVGHKGQVMARAFVWCLVSAM